MCRLPFLLPLLPPRSPLPLPLSTFSLSAPLLTGSAFYADAVVCKLALHAQELKVGWGKASPVPAQSGASRNVYLGGLDEGMTEEMLRDKLSRFGLIDQVVNTLPTDPAWVGKHVTTARTAAARYDDTHFCRTA
ncbi:hypothetical protein DFH08DRAFT_931953 [Mycena albidolilacea]|uniref:RRM domain-containing protein n=1 Tax=Mycena albidolilacea TaxID=1033008 RepID=A0AAD7AI66_9AGAR|nr:hypothetical protein DFH08DRAFT_931953 [Mycena albidolilacea]